MIKFKSKYLCMVIFCVAFALSLCGIMVSTKPNAASAETDITKALNDFSLKDGASVRIGSSYTDSGLKYAFIMPKESYETVKSTYPDATFGILIAPNEWLDDKGSSGDEDYSLTAENVFGANAKYCYATWDSENNTWVAPTESNKKQIINFNTSVIAGESGSNVFFFGSMTNVLSKNYIREFAAVPYISYTVDGTTQYVFKTRQNSNIRSITYVAMLAIESNDNTIDKDFLQEKYVEVAKGVDTTYSVNYYKQNGDSYEEVGAPSTKETTVATKVVATPNAYEGYVLNAEKSTLTGNAYPNNKLNLSIYYDKIVAGETILLDKKDKTDLTLEGLLLSDAQKAAFADLKTLENGSIKWWLGGTELTSTDMTDIEGVYEVKAEYYVDSNTRCVLYSNTVDFYNSADGLVWQKQNALSLDNLSIEKVGDCQGIESAVVTGDDIPANATATQYYKVSSPAQSSQYIGWAIDVTPLHSKAYYESWAKKGTFNVSFDFYSEGTSYRQIHYGYTHNNYQTQQGVWKTVTMSLSDLIKKYNTSGEWKPTGDSYYNRNMLGDGDAYYYGSAQTMYFGNFYATFVSTGDVLDRTLTTTLKDLKDTDTFELTTLISNEDKTTLGDISSYTWYLNGVAVEGSTISSSSVDGVYEVSLGYEVYPYKLVVYKTSVDFYNSNDGLVWQLANTLSIDNLVITDKNSKDLTYSVVTGDDIPTGASANVYYKITNGGDDNTDGKEKDIGWFANVLGIHSKGYYLMWQTNAKEKNQTITVTYEYQAFRVENRTEHTNVDGKKDYGDKVSTQINVPFTYGATGAANGLSWLTRSMTLDKIIENWDKLSKTNVGYHEAMIVNYDAYYYGSAQTMYVGNFTTTVTDNATAE